MRFFAIIRTNSLFLNIIQDDIVDIVATLEANEQRRKTVSGEYFIKLSKSIQSIQ